jgi:prenyltransferase beta subunit
MTWQVGSFGILALVLFGGFLWYERVRPSARVLSLVAALAALAVVGRLAFAAIPNVKPTTDIVLFAGYALGGVPGFAVGAVTALVSNVFLSQGPWTAWQMVGWGAVGVGGGLLARAARGRELGRLWLAVACGLAGLAFGAWMDVYQWTLAARQDLDSYLAISASSLPYNLAHAIGNVVFCLVIGPVFIRALRRYRRRFEVRWEPLPAAAVALVALAVAAWLAAAPVAQAARPSTRAVRYLGRVQNLDGGFGGARGQASSGLYTGWTALGLASARRNPRDVHRRRGHAVTTYIRRRSGSLRDVGSIERTILVLRASGLSARRFAGRNLVAELLAQRRQNGSWRSNVTHTAFGILALKSVRDPSGGPSANWLRGAQNGDGGFGFTAQAASDVDDTGAVLQAFAAAGLSGGAGTRRAVSYLRGAQNGDGGFGQMAGRSSNAQSTAWAVQGLVAVGAADDSVSRAIGYLVSLQRGNGSIRYSRSSTQTPVWVTAEALAAMRRKPFPLAAVRRKSPPHHARSAAATQSKRSGTRRSRARRKAGSETAPAAQLAQRAAVRALAEVRTRPASAAPRATLAPEGREGVSPWLLAGAGAATLVLLWLLRRFIRRRRPAVS